MHFGTSSPTTGTTPLTRVILASPKSSAASGKPARETGVGTGDLPDLLKLSRSGPLGSSRTGLSSAKKRLDAGGRKGDSRVRYALFSATLAGENCLGQLLQERLDFPHVGGVEAFME